MKPLLALPTAAALVFPLQPAVFSEQLSDLLLELLDGLLHELPLLVDCLCLIAGRSLHLPELVDDGEQVVVVVLLRGLGEE
jgi:hypothetical protein